MSLPTVKASAPFKPESRHRDPGERIEAYLDRVATTPIINKLHQHEELCTVDHEPTDRMTAFCGILSKLHQDVSFDRGALGEDLVGFHRAKLGKQLFRWDGSRRYHVWELRDSGNLILRIYINNVRGLSLEVPVGFDLAGSIEALGTYRMMLDLDPDPAITELANPAQTAPTVWKLVRFVEG